MEKQENSMPTTEQDNVFTLTELEERVEFSMCGGSGGGCLGGSEEVCHIK